MSGYSLYGLHNPHYNYNCGNYTLTNKNIFVNLGIVRSYEESRLYREHIASTVQKVRLLIGLCFRRLVNRNSEFLVRVYKAYDLPILKYGSSSWSPIQRRDVTLLEKVQRRFTKCAMLATKISYGERLHTLELLS